MHKSEVAFGSRSQTSMKPKRGGQMREVPRQTRPVKPEEARHPRTRMLLNREALKRHHQKWEFEADWYEDDY